MTDSTTDRRTALKIIGGGVAAAPLMAQAAVSAHFDCGVAIGDRALRASVRQPSLRLRRSEGWWARQDLNLRPIRYERTALTS